MNLKIDDPNNSGLFAKYLSGEMDEMELMDFERQFFESEGDKEIIEKMKHNWSAVSEYDGDKLPDANKAWEKLHNRLLDENLIATQKATPKQWVSSGFVKIAAAVIILFTVSALVYLSQNRKPALEMISLNTQSETNTLIKTLADGSIIYIAQNSSFSFPKKFEDASRNVELKGEAFFDIMPNPNQPFIIETDEALIQVLGTAFNVKTQNGSAFRLFVERGKVKVTLKKQPSHTVFVVAGESITTINNGLVKSKTNANGFPAWYKQRMHFKDEPLNNIISVLNRNFNTTFVLANTETGKRKLTVTFKNETAETMTELLCATLNLKSQNSNGSVVLSEIKAVDKRN
jgi:ferric-dicitrate binding protein FerR (iron transport regulator)